MPGKTNDPAVVALKIAALHGLYNIKSLAYDRWRIEDLRRELNAIGCDVELVPFGQGFKDMSPAVEILERNIVSATLRHAMHPILTWCAGNAVCLSDPAGGRKLDKAKSHGRIDGLVALAMALCTATRGSSQQEWVPFIDVI
jgi:phage terminase large subunit-like protein